MKSLKTGFGLTTLAIALLAASPAGAEELVPPGNSAVNQYTESFPTAGGKKNVGANKGAKRSPGKVLGTRNVRRLEQHGSEGRQVAELATETAPPVAKEETSVPAPAGQGKGGGGDKARGAKSGGPSRPPARSAPRPIAAPPVEAPETEGSSGLSEVLAQAFGSPSSGQLGLLMPLAIAGAIFWAFAYRRRQERRAG